MQYCKMVHHNVTHSEYSDFVICHCISQPAAYVLFVYTPIQFEVCYVAKKKVPCLPVIANAKTVHKILSIRQNWFLSTLEQLAVCRRDNQDHTLIFNVLFRVRKWNLCCLFNCHLQFFTISHSPTDVAALLSRNIFIHLLTVTHDRIESYLFINLNFLWNACCTAL